MLNIIWHITRFYHQYITIYHLSSDFILINKIFYKREDTSKDNFSELDIAFFILDCLENSIKLLHLVFLLWFC